MAATCHIEAGPELNIVHAAEVRQTWLSQIDADHTCIEINLSAVQEMDSAGLQLLLALQRSAQLGGKQMVLSHPSRVVRDVLDIFGLSDHFAQAATH